MGAGSEECMIVANLDVFAHAVEFVIEERSLIAEKTS